MNLTLRKISCLIFLFPFMLRSYAQPQPEKFVNPFIGTGGAGHTFPGASVPFGMVQLSPDTRIDASWEACSGYHYSDTAIYGFSHTHLSGTGVPDYGDILLLPLTERPQLKGPQKKIGYSHSDEKASAGYYEVNLKNKVKVKLTASTRAGFHEYQFPSKTNAWIVLDLSHRDETLEAHFWPISKTRIAGMRRSKAWAADQYIYFVAEFSVPFDSTLSYIEEGRGGTYRYGFYFQKVSKVMVKVGISTVSIDGAGKNLDAEMKHWDFNKVKEEAEKAWNKELSKIMVNSSDENKLTIFYTALYHTMLQPNVNMDVDGKYRGMDNQIHQAKGFTYYSVFSLWDTFRAAHPLYTLIDRKRSNDFIKTFLCHFNEGGKLPVWELASNETNCMIGYHSVSVIADAYFKNIRDYDAELAFKAMLHSANSATAGLKKYAEQGYLGSTDEHESVSKTLEYAYDDWCIAQLAKALGKTPEYTTFINRSTAYQNLFDKSTGHMRPIKNGKWLEPFDPKEVNNDFTEGNSWQYSFFVPHDIEGLIRLYGGKKELEEKLDALFTESSKTTGRVQADISGLIGQYAHGNEPSHHIAYLYQYLHKPYKTQKLINKILTTFYTNEPNGLIGNEDCGQMSAWYILSALGMYQVCPGNLNFCLNTPLFNKSTITLENGKKLNISCDADPTSHNYLKSVNKRQSFYLTYNQLMQGGNIDLQLSTQEPDLKQADFVPTTSLEAKVNLPLPQIHFENFMFRDSLQVEIELPFNNCELNLLYSCGNKKESRLVLTGKSKKISIDTSCVLTIWYRNSNGEESRTITAKFHKITNDWSVQLTYRYDKNYSANGDAGIIDGYRGEENWRKGWWQGYQGTDFEAIVDLKKLTAIHELGLGCLQDISSWIFFPKRVEVETSADGINYRKAGEVINEISDKEMNSITKDFCIKLNQPINARFVKVKAKNYGTLPAWHKGAGGEAYIFTDEIIIK